MIESVTFRHIEIPTKSELSEDDYICQTYPFTEIGEEQVYTWTDMLGGFLSARKEPLERARLGSLRVGMVFGCRRYDEHWPYTDKYEWTTNFIYSPKVVGIATIVLRHREIRLWLNANVVKSIERTKQDK
jgi:hypothetical protein